VVIRPDAVEQQGLTLSTGVSRDTVGSKGLCMRLMMLPPGTRGTPHSHNGHESAIWVAMGAPTRPNASRLSSSTCRRT
jgi:uncharacterized RmlC-like cupin family protein